MKKNWWKSKTIWFNVITGAIAVADQLSGKVIAPETAATAIAIGNIILRFITKEEIK